MFNKLFNTACKNSTNIFNNFYGAVTFHGSSMRRAYEACHHYYLSPGQKTLIFNDNEQWKNQEPNPIKPHGQSSNHGWDVSSLALVVLGSIVAYLFTKDGTVQAAEDDEKKELTNVDADKITVVTRENFKEILTLLINDSPNITSLEITFALSEGQLQELYNAIKNNNELGYITWDEDRQVRYKTLQQIETKLIDNNRDYKYYPSDYDFVLLSTHAYVDSKEGDLVKLEAEHDQYLKNWKIEKVFADKESGYYGVIYINDITHQIVLANRGTEGGVMGVLTDAGKQNSDWKTNLEEILLGKVVIGQQEKNYEATRAAIKIAKEKGYKFSITGHSLGAWLAEMSAFYCHAFFQYPNVKAVTFDGPGSLPMMKKLQSSIKDKDIDVDLKDIQIVNYLTIPNPVNCCNRHVGKVYKIAPKMEWSDWVNNTIPDFMTKIFGKENMQGVLAVESHLLTGILETFDPKTGKPKAYQRMADWPRMEYTGEERNFTGPGNKVAKEMLDKTLDKKLDQTILSSVVKKGVDYGFEFLVGDKTLMTMIGFLKNLHQVDQEQYWAYFRYIGSDENNSEAREKVAYDDRFALVAKAKYRKTDDINILRLQKGSIDDFLYELNKSKENLDNIKDLPEIAKNQLKDLLSTFTIKQISDNKYSLVPKVGYSAENIRQRMQRLLCVVPKKVLDSVQSMVVNEHKTIIQANGPIRFEGTSVTKVAEHLPLEPDNYIEIEGKRKELEDALRRKNIAVVSGIGGMGKSTFVAEYGRDCKKEGWQVRWLKGAQIDEEFLKLARDLNIKTSNSSPEEVRDLVYGSLERFDKKQVLLVFHNAEDREKVKEYVRNLPNHVKVIITSRNGGLLQEIGVKPINLGGFSREEAISYVQGSLGKSEIEARKIVETVTESPFRLSKAVAYLRKQLNLKTVDEFIKEYEAIKAGKHQDNEIYPEVELLFRDLKKKSPEGWKLLKYMAYLDAEGVPLELINNLMEKSSLDLHRYVYELDQLSLMNVVGEGNNKVLKVSHRIVQNETKKALFEEDGVQPREILKKLICELDRLFPKVNRNSKHPIEVVQWLGHAKLLIEEASKVGLPFIDRKDLISKLGNYYLVMGISNSETINYWKELLNYQRSIHQENHPDVMWALNSIGIAYLGTGKEEDVRKGILFLKEALERGQILFPGKNAEVAMILNNLAIAYDGLEGEENAKEGLSFANKAFAVHQDIGLFGNWSEVAMVASTLGNAYRKLAGKDNLMSGLLFHKLSLKIRKKLFPGNHPEVAKSLHNVGISCQDLGGEENIRKAKKYLKRSLKMNQELFPDKHVQTAISFDGLSLTYLGLGGEKNLRKGLKCATKSLKMYRELGIGNLRNEMILLSKIGIFYVKLEGEENIREALKYAQDAFNIGEEIYPYAHPQMATIFNTWGVAYRELGGENLKESLKCFEESLKRVQGLFPNNHYLVARVLYNMGLTHLAIGGEKNAREGLRCARESLYMNQELFGEDNLQVALSLNSISIACRQLGGEENVREGLKSANQSLKTLQRLFPTNNPDIAMVLDNLGTYYQMLGDEGKALELKKQAYGIYLATFREGYAKTKEIKSQIELLQPEFFRDQEQSNRLQQQDCLGGNVIGGECRWPIFFQGSVDNDSIKLKQQIQRSVLHGIAKAVEDYGWSYEIFWQLGPNYGVKGYLEENYLKKELGEFSNNDENIEDARMYCFEAMNLGILKSKKKPFEVLRNFTRENPELVKEIAVEHPEFFVDGSIVEACVEAMPEDKSFERHIFEHVKYMGMEARKEKVLKTVSGFEE